MIVDKAKIGLFLIFNFFLLAACENAFANEELERSYSIQADFRNIKRRTFAIEMDASITNKTQKTLTELQWMLYPNRFLQELPNLNDLSYRRIYPDGFSKGELHIQSLKDGDREVSQTLKEISLSPLPSRTLFSLPLNQPLLPGETRVFHFTMQLTVPEKFGSFGYYRHRLTLSGGWTPYLVSYRNGLFEPTDQSPKSDWKVKIRTDDKLVVGSDFFEKDAESEKIFEKKNQGQFPIQIGSQLQKTDFQHKDYSLQIVLGEKHPEKILRSLHSVFNPWAEYISEQNLNTLSDKNEITLVQAPLREMLVLDAGEVSFFSDRAYKVVGAMTPFHNVPFVRMLFSQIVFPKVTSKENDRDYYWINEAISTQLTEEFIQTQHYKQRDARNLGLVRLFKIFPIIDQIIHAPQFAFFDVFYNFVYPYDPVRDDVDRFQSRRQFGVSVLAHMTDELGKDMVRNIIRTYLQSPDKTFQEVAENYAGKSLDDRFAFWTNRRPAINYKIGKIKTHKDGEVRNHEITVIKETETPLHEPVELRVEEKGGSGQTLTWNSEESAHVYNVQTQKKLKNVEIDPDARLLETNLGDNRRPPRMKFVLTEAFFQYDYNAGQPMMFVQSEIRKKYGAQNIYNFGGFYQADSYGLNLGYSRLFGRRLDNIRLSDGAGLRFNFIRLNKDDVLVDSTPPQIVTITDASFISSISASYFFGNQISFTNPMSGGYGGVSLTYGTKALGGDFNYYQVLASAAWVFKIHPSHLFAIRGLLGNSGPDSIPSQIQFRLGGIDSMRGLSLDSEEYIGRNIALASAEYRHFLIQDIDINLFIVRIRDVQGAVFTDAGRTTDTIQEKADQSVFGAAIPSTTFRDVFRVQDFEADVGYGIRFFADYVGVSPSIIRFDIAKSITDNSQGYRLYFGVTQSF